MPLIDQNQLSPFSCMLGNKLIRSGATLHRIFVRGVCDGLEAHPERSKPQNAVEGGRKLARKTSTGGGLNV